MKMPTFGISPIQQRMASMRLPQQPQPAAAQPAGFLGNAHNFASGNQNALIAAGLGMLSGQNNQQAFGNAMQGYLTGQQADQAKAGQNATEAYLAKRGHSPEEIAFFKANPDMMRSALQPKTSAMDAKVKMLVSTGVDEQTAMGIASGRLKTSINPNTGERVIIDMGDQSIIPLSQPQYADGGPAQAPATPEQMAPGETLMDMAPDATGVGASVKRGLSDTLGQIPGPVGDMTTSPDVVKAQTNFSLFTRELVRTLSLNPRFPVAEQQRIEGLMPTGALVSPETLKISIVEMDKELARLESELGETASDPQIPLAERQADEKTLRFVMQARRRLGVPQQESAPPDAPGVPATDLKTKYGLE